MSGRDGDDFVLVNRDRKEVFRDRQAGYESWARFVESHKDKLRNVVIPRRAGPLDGIDLSGADLTGTKFSGCSMDGALFEKAILEAADFYKCSLNGADLRGAELKGARLAECSLKDADLRESRLDGTDFSRSDLLRAALDDCWGEGTNLSRTRLDYVSWQLATLNHPDFSYSRFSGGSDTTRVGRGSAGAGRYRGDDTTYQASIVGGNYKGVEDLFSAPEAIREDAIRSDIIYQKTIDIGLKAVTGAALAATPIGTIAMLPLEDTVGTFGKAAIKSLVVKSGLGAVGRDVTRAILGDLNYLESFQKWVMEKARSWKGPERVGRVIDSLLNPVGKFVMLMNHNGDEVLHKALAAAGYHDMGWFKGRMKFLGQEVGTVVVCDDSQMGTVMAALDLYRSAKGKPVTLVRVGSEHANPNPNDVPSVIHIRPGVGVKAVWVEEGKRPSKSICFDMKGQAYRLDSPNGRISGRENLQGVPELPRILNGFRRNLEQRFNGETIMPWRAKETIQFPPETHNIHHVGDRMIVKRIGDGKTDNTRGPAVLDLISGEEIWYTNGHKVPSPERVDLDAALAAGRGNRRLG